MIYLACNEECVPCVSRNNPPGIKSSVESLSNAGITEWLTDCLVSWLSNWPINWLTGLLAFPTDWSWLNDWLVVLLTDEKTCVTLLKTHRLQLIGSLNGGQEGCVCIEWSRSQLTIQDHCLHETGTIDTPSFKWPQIVNPNLDRPKKMHSKMLNDTLTDWQMASEWLSKRKTVDCWLFIFFFLHSEIITRKFHWHFEYNLLL